MSRVGAAGSRLGATAGLLLVAMIAVLLALALSNRPEANDGPINPVGAQAPAPVASQATAPNAESETDPFAAKCVTESHRSVRALTADELRQLDATAKARGGDGWLIAGDRWAKGQLWIGDRDSAVQAYGGTNVVSNVAGRPGDWIVTEREGTTIAVTLRPIELPSGTVLWAPHNTIVPMDCPPDA